jgi:thioredoxin-dependent peroxiredoxin
MPQHNQGQPAGGAAPIERDDVFQLAGKPATIVGDDVQVGQPAPRFTSQVGFWPGMEIWDSVDPLQATAGKVRIIAAVPSLETSVCDRETRRFNEEAAGLGDDVRVITISADLPPTQKRWCGAAGIDRVVVVSDHMTAEFGARYGALIKQRRQLRRAVFVVGPDDVVRYADYMPTLGDEPNYEAVLAAARDAVGGGQL